MAGAVEKVHGREPPAVFTVAREEGVAFPDAGGFAPGHPFEESEDLTFSGRLSERHVGFFDPTTAVFEAGEDPDGGPFFAGVDFRRFEEQFRHFRPFDHGFFFRFAFFFFDGGEVDDLGRVFADRRGHPEFGHRVAAAGGRFDFAGAATGGTVEDDETGAAIFIGRDGLGEGFRCQRSSSLRSSASR